MISAPWRRYAALILLLLAGLAGTSGQSSDLLAPRTFMRGASPSVETITFTAPAPMGAVMYIETDGLATAAIRLNDVEVFSHANFKPKVTTYQKNVSVAASNVLAVSVRGTRGNWVRIRIAGGDTEGPVVQATVTPAANTAGWHKGPATVTFTCSDALSGIATCPAAVTVSAEGAGQVVSGEAVDRAGNRTSTSVTLNIDRTPPVVTPSTVPPATADGWHNQDVTVSFACSDPISGIAACSDAVVVTGIGKLKATGSATDRAGNTATVVLPVNIDRTAPTITSKLSVRAVSDGWHGQPPTVSFTCRDDRSGIASCSDAVEVTTEGAGQVVPGTTSDRAGNTAQTSVTIKLDLTPPQITPTFSIPPTAAGWHREPVTATFACEDALSGVTSCPSPKRFSTVGITDYSFVARDRAGHTTTLPMTVRIDRTPPTITGSVSAGPAGSRIVTFVCNDDLSGVEICSAPVTVPANAPTQTVEGVATDNAGNTAKTSVNVGGVDPTKPSISASVAPQPNSAGWHSAPQVVVSFTCAPTGVTCPAPVVVTTEGASQTVSGTARDGAGNEASTSVQISLDRTAPVISITSPTTTVVGEAAVTIAGTAPDSLSGLVGVTCAGAPATLTGNAFSCTANLTPGPNTIAIAAVDRAGNTSTTNLSLTLMTNGTPIARAGGPYSGETGSPIRFDGSASSDPEEQALTFQWTFGDGGKATGMTPTHTFTEPGTFGVELTVTDTTGASSTASTTVTITRANRAPIANAGGPYTGDAAQPITLTATASTDPDDDPLTYSWTFGDGSSATGSVVQRAYATPGSYTATLTVDDGRGGTATATAQVTVRAINQRPTAQIGGPYAGQAGQPISFSGSGSDPDNDSLTFTWTFGDGASATGQSVSHAYATAGSFTATLTVSDGRGGTHAASAQVNIEAANSAPVARIEAPARADAGITIDFSGAGSTDADGDPLTYSWSFGDGRSATGVAPRYAYSAAGPFTVTLTVSDGRGGTHSTTASITIDPAPTTNRPPTANAGGPYSGEVNVAIAFSSTGSTDPDGDALTYAWDFGDGGTSTAASPSHPYAAAGPYTVTLTVSDGRGGSHSKTASVSIGAQVDRAPPVVSLQGPSQVLPGARPSVQATVTDNVGVASVVFEVAGSASAPMTAPPFVREVVVPSVTAPGSTIPVKAIAKDAAGNTSVAEIALTVVEQPDNTPPVVLLLAPGSAAPGATVRLTAEASDNDGVASVTFSIGGTPIATDTQAPFEATYVIPDDAAVGSLVQVSARAVDHTGNGVSTTAAISIVATADTQPPSVQLTAPATAVAGSPVVLSATATDNSGIAAVAFFVDGVRIATAATAPYATSYIVPPAAVPGTVLKFEAQAIDFAGLQTSDVRQLQVTALEAAEVFVVGEVFDDATGLPLQGATVTVQGASGAPLLTDEAGRFAFVAAAGPVSVRISRDGYTAVDRAAVATGGVIELIDARLTPRTGTATQVTPTLGAELQAGNVRLIVPAGSLAAAQSMSLTVVGPQGLMGLLPAGWSPVAIVDVAPHGVAFGAPATLRVPPPQSGSGGLILALWDAQAGGWRALSTSTDGAVQLDAAISSTGQFAWLRPDVVPVAPPQPALGQVIAGIVVGDLPEAAVTSITPQPTVVFYQPGVQATVNGVVTSTVPLSSGTRLWSRVSESYKFFSGAQTYPDPTVQDIFFYQSQPAGTELSARYTVTPSRTFEALSLERGVIALELYEPATAATAGEVIPPSGGTVALATGEQLTFAPGATVSPIAASLKRATAEELGVPIPSEFQFLGAVDVTLSSGVIAPGVLSISKPAGLEPTAQVLLARIVTFGDRTRFVLAAVGRVDGDRLIGDPVLPLNLVQMDGVLSSGRYVFLRAMVPVGFVAGQVITQAGTGVDGAQVSSETLPIVGLSRGVSGRYVAAIRVAAVTLTAVNPQTSDRATGSVTLAVAGQEAALDLRLVAELPRVLSITPAANATGVPQSSPIVAVFSEPIDPSTVTANVSLTAGGAAIAGTTVFSAGNTVLTFRPADALDPDVVHTFTLGAGIADVTGQTMGTPFVLTFTTLDTTPPPIPPAGALSASIPVNGTTTVRGTQGTAGLHDTVTVENVTRGTSTPVLLDPNGGFNVLVQAAAGDTLRLKIVDSSGNETILDLPAFTRENPDGSVSGVVGAAGGRVNGPDGTAVDVPEGSLPDGTIVTVKSVSEAAFPVKLTDDQKAVFGYAGGVQVDFGGATPSRYVNISVPKQSGDTSDDQWIVAQIITVGGAQVLNAVDTAKLIDDRVRTSSPPCPGVLAAGTYGIYKSAHPVGLAFGRMYAMGTYDGLRLSVDVVPTLSGIAVPFPVYAWENPQPVCLPVLTGRVTVGMNTTRFRIAPDALQANDREIVVRNVTAGGKESHFRRDLLEYAFEVPGTLQQNFTAKILTTTNQEVAVDSIDVQPGPSGKVIVTLDADAISASVSKVVITNTSVQPAAVHEFTVDQLAFEVTAGGGLDDMYWITAIDADGVTRRIEPTGFEKLASAHGPGNMLARALDGTIDPTLEEFRAANPGAPDPPKWRTRVELIASQNNKELSRVEIPASRIVNGGFHFAFEGEDAFDYALDVIYNTGERDFVRIHRLRLTITNPQTGQVVKTIAVPAPRRDEPLGIGPITNDGQPPLLTGSPVRLNSFDPTTPLTFTFSEAMDADSIRQNAIVERVGPGGRVRVNGTWRIYDQNRTATFVPDAPLQIGEEYSITFVGADSLGGVIAPGAQPVTDLGGNAIATMRLQVKTFTPRIVATVERGANGRVMDEIYDIQIRRTEENGTSKTYLMATTSAWQDGPKFVIFDATTAEATREAGFGFGGWMQKQLTFVADIGKNGNPPLTFRQAQPGPTPQCGPVGPTYTGDLAVSAGYNIDYSFVQVWHPGAPSTDGEGRVSFQPCLLTSKLLTANPETLNSFTRPGTVHAQGFAEAVATIRHDSGIAAFTAVREVGLFATDLGPQIPELVPAERQTDAFVSGDFYDVVAFQDRLLAANNGGKSLDIFDPNLAQLGSVALPGGARHVVVAENYGVDEDGDGFIRPSEVRNLAFVATRDCPGGPSCNYTIQVVNLKNFSNPEVIGYIPMPGFISSLDIDPEKRRLFATGYATQTQQTSAFFMIDISRPTGFAADANQDGLDDRIVWKKEFPTFLNSARIDKERGLAYIPVSADDGTRKGRLEVWAIYDNCCDLAVDFVAAPSQKQSGNREGLLRKEREALRQGIKMGLAQATTTCGLNAATVTILEQGSGACLWRGRCDDNYQPGLSDHDYEVFVPDALWDVRLPDGRNVATCTADVLTQTFIDPVTSEPKTITLPNGETMAFEDITFFPEVRERFESASFDVERPESSGSDAVGDMGLGRRSLLLKWLLEGAYVTGVDGYNVEGRSLDAILQDLKNVTRIPRLEGYEWSVLQDFNLAKSKAFLRIGGASRADSAFHKLFVKQLHDAGKAGIRATMARLVAHPASNTMVLDVTRQQFDTNACYEISVAVPNPNAWPQKPCSSFEEYVASAAARTLRENRGVFTLDEVVNQANRFYRVKSDRERIVSEQKADAFIAMTARFIANAKALTLPVYTELLASDPDRVRRTENMAIAQEQLPKVLKEVKVHVVPHVFSRGFRNGTGLRVAMYHTNAAGTGTLDKEVRVDLAGGDDKYLSYLRNPDGTLALSNGKAVPLFQLKVDTTQGFSQPRGVSFVIDLPDRTMRESNRQNNVDGFFYYVLDRATGATPAVPSVPHMPLPGTDLLEPSPECYDSPMLKTTQHLTVGDERIGDEVVLGRGEAVTIHLTVQNFSGETAHNVLACSNITNQCYDVGSLAAGEARTIQVSYVTPDQDVYLDGTPSAFSPQSGVLTGAPTRIIVSGDTFAIQPMMDDAIVASIDPELLNIEAGGQVTRHYRIVGKRSGQPRPNLPITGEIEGFFGSQVQKRPLTFVTNAKGEICTPAASGCTDDVRGLEIPYQESMITGTNYTVTLMTVAGNPISPENHTAFTFMAKDRAYSQSYAVGGQIGAGVKILGGADFDEEDGFELSKSATFFGGPKELGLTLSRQYTFKRKAEASLKLAFKTPVIAGKAELKAGTSFSTPVSYTHAFAFPYKLNADPRPEQPRYILEFDAHCAIATLTANQLAQRNPLINKIADLLAEEPCGDPNKFAKSHAVKGGGSFSASTGLEVGLQAPLFGRVGNERPTLGITAGLSGVGSVSVEHETSVKLNESGEIEPTSFKTSIGLFGQVELSGSVGLSLDETFRVKNNGVQPSEKQVREDFFAMKSVKKALAVSGSRATGGAFGLDIEQDKDGVVEKVSISFAQPKTWGWNGEAGGDGVGVNRGVGFGRSISFSLTLAEDKEKALAAIANLQQLANAVADDGAETSLLTLTPTKINDEILGLRTLLFNTVATYQISESEGTGVELPFGFEGQIAKVGVSAKLAFKGDSKVGWVVERGVNYRGNMLPLQTYTNDDYVPSADLGLGSFIAQMWESVNAAFGPAYTYVAAEVTPGAPPVELRSPNTAIMTLDPGKEEQAFEASLFSYKFRDLSGPVADAPMVPSATSGPAGQPHYGVGGFHHFGPNDRALGAPTRLVIDYKDPDIAGLNESTFAIYGWNATTNDWDHIGGVVDPVANTVTANVNSLRLYTLAPAMPARDVVMTATDQGQTGSGENAKRRFSVTSAPLVMNNGQPVADGTLFTVRSFAGGSSDETPFGTILTGDADPSRENVQVQVVNGRLQFDVELSSPAGLFIPARVVVHSTVGTAYGEVTLTGGGGQ